jgi:hypothetical protein
VSKAVTVVQKKALEPKHAAFVIEYMKDRNATQAYIRAGYSPNGANRNASVLMARHDVRAEIDRRIEEYERTAGLSRVKLLEFLRDAVFADPSKILHGKGLGGVLPPDQWPEDVKKLVTGYKAGTATTAESVTFTDRTSLALKLMDEIRPLDERKESQVSVTVNVQNLMALLTRGPQVQT